ncbi:MAG: GNAT family N-acetyltransferase [Nanoarchaeota archaeon]
MKIILLNKNHIRSASKIMVESYWDSILKAKIELLKKIKSKEGYVCINNKEILGLFLYSRNYSHYANYLEDIIVSQNHRRKGVSYKLLEKYISVSKKETPKKQIFALSSTSYDNKPSIYMHLKFGFKEAGRIASLHYGKDEIFFVYNLRGRK